MQYPPQSPGEQISYTSAEIYQPEQPPAKEVEPEPRPAPTLIVYANRIRVARNLSALTNRLIIVSLMFILLAYFLHSFTSTDLSNSPALNFSLTLFMLVYALMLTRIALNRWIAGRSLLVNNEPVIVISSEGIAMRGSLSFGTAFLPWREIESVDIYTFRYRYMCVRPRNTASFMKRLPLLERILKQIDLFYGIPPLSIASFYLDKPVEEILQQLYHMYAKELSYHQVQLRS